MKPLLALDFDGVICDSLDECLVSAVNARARLQGVGRPVRRPEEVDPDLAAGFRTHRHLVRPAGEYETLLHWLTTRDQAPTAESFAALVRKRADEVKAFQAVFFAVRAALRATNPAAWTALHRRYRQAADGWETLAADFEIHLVTTKDLPSVRHFNEAWQLGLVDAHLHAAGSFANKAEAVNALAAAAGRTPRDVIFVDDHPGHLADVAATGAQCWWASWGYADHADGWPALQNLAEVMTVKGIPA